MLNYLIGQANIQFLIFFLLKCMTFFKYLWQLRNKVYFQGERVSSTKFIDSVKQKAESFMHVLYGDMKNTYQLRKYSLLAHLKIVCIFQFQPKYKMGILVQSLSFKLGFFTPKRFYVKYLHFSQIFSRTHQMFVANKRTETYNEQ